MAEMDARRAYQVIAWGNVGVGIVVGAAILVGLLAAVTAERHVGLWLILVVLGLFGLVAAGLIRAGCSHLRRPSLSSALNLAVNTAVIVWFLTGMLIGGLGGRATLGPGYVLIGVAVGYTAYRYWLKPQALRAFPDPPASE